MADELPDFDLPDLLPPLAPEPREGEAGPAAPGLPPAPPDPLPAPAPHELRTIPRPPQGDGKSSEGYSLPEMDVPDGREYRTVGDPPGLTETEDAGTSPIYARHQAAPAPRMPQDEFRAAGGPPALPDLQDAAEGRPGPAKGTWDSLESQGGGMGQDYLDTGESYDLHDTGGRLDRLADSLDSLVRHLQAPPTHAPSPTPRVDVGGSTFDR